MHPSVFDAWYRFSEPFEGRINLLYVDTKGLVTAGVGCLCDSVADAQRFPWVVDLGLPTERPATHAEVAADWHKVKEGKLYLQGSAAQTRIRLTDGGIDFVAHERLMANEAYIKRKVFPQWDFFPADAQLAIMSMCWAVGAGLDLKFPNFCGIVRNLNWTGAKIAGHINIGVQGTPSWNPGVIPRNKANELCFDNAQVVKELGLDITVLHWPKAVDPIVPASELPPDEEPTKPDTPALIPLERDREAELEEVKDAVRKIT